MPYGLRHARLTVETEDLVDEIIDEVESVTEAIDDVEDTGEVPAVSSIKEARDRRAEQLALDAEEAAQPEAAQVEHEDDFEDSIEHDVAVPDTMRPTQEASRTSPCPQLGRDHVRRQAD